MGLVICGNGHFSSSHHGVPKPESLLLLVLLAVPLSLSAAISGMTRLQLCPQP
jgi:hypothetical protein